MNFFKQTVLFTLITSLITPSITWADNSLDMINNNAKAITNNNFSEFMTSLPAGTQSQQIYSQTSARPFLTAVHYPDEAITIIYIVSSSRDFRTGQVNMSFRKLNPEEESKSWMDAPRASKLFGSNTNPTDPFKQFKQTSGTKWIPMNSQLRPYNWAGANAIALPAILSMLSLKYNAQKVGMINLQTVRGVRQWEDKDDWGITVDYYARSRTWVKPDIYMADYRENSGSMGSLTSYGIKDCSGKCDVISSLKFIPVSNTGDAKTEFSLVHDSGDVNYDSGFNQLVIAVIGAFFCPVCSAVFLTTSLINGNSLTNTYISGDHLAIGTVLTSLNPVTAAASGFMLEDKGGALDVNNTNSVSQLLGINNGTTNSTISTNGTIIDRNSIENVQNTLTTKGINQETLKNSEETRKEIFNTYDEVQNTILINTQKARGDGENAQFGLTQAQDANRYEIGGNDSFNPVSNIIRGYITNDAFKNDGNNVIGNFAKPVSEHAGAVVNSTNHRYTQQTNQDGSNDVELLRKVSTEDSVMLQIGGSSFANEMRKSQYADQENVQCSPSPENPCTP